MTPSKSKNRLYSIVFLILIYAMGTVGVFSAYYTCYHRLDFQVKVKENKDADLQKIVFTEKEYQSIQWVELETEFEWQGKMYDVSKITRIGEGYVLLCENDSFEDMMISFFKFGKGTASQNIKKGNPQPQFFCSIYKLPLRSGIGHKKEIHNPSYSLYHSIRPEISSPPPRLFHC